MELWQSLVLGIVHGIMQFLPVSSNGHLVLLQDFLLIEPKTALAFNALAYCATASALLWYFRQEILTLMQTLFRKLGRLPVNPKDVLLGKALGSALIPALIALVVQSYSEVYLSSNLLIAGGLIFGALLYMFAEWKNFMQGKSVALTGRSAVSIGIFQLLACIPGVSRIGVTIAGGMMLGLARYEAAKFAFLLTIPLSIVIAVKKTLELLVTPGEITWLTVSLGAVTAFVIALFIIKHFLQFVRRNTLWPFIWYSLVLAALIIYGEFFAF